MAEAVRCEKFNTMFHNAECQRGQQVMHMISFNFWAAPVPEGSAMEYSAGKPRMPLRQTPPIMTSCSHAASRNCGAKDRGESQARRSHGIAVTEGCCGGSPIMTACSVRVTGGDAVLVPSSTMSSTAAASSFSSGNVCPSPQSPAAIATCAGLSAAALAAALAAPVGSPGAEAAAAPSESAAAPRAGSCGSAAALASSSGDGAALMPLPTGVNPSAGGGSVPGEPADTSNQAVSSCLGGAAREQRTGDRRRSHRRRERLRRRRVSWTRRCGSCA